MIDNTPVNLDPGEAELERQLEHRGAISQFRHWFREAVDYAEKWQEEAQEDYDFVAGKQWTESDKKAFAEMGRPAITINRIKPLINVLSGYQRLNRYDIEFLPRTSDDMDVCQVRKAMTKYVMDRCDYDTQESLAFLDAAIAGVGWFEVGYKSDEELDDGEAFVRREDPFGMYVDPEAHKLDYSDAKYICRAKWVDKDNLKDVFPEHAEEIEAQYQVYDSAERTEGRRNEAMLWYKRDLDKVRLVECWYKTKEKQTQYYLTDGTMVPQQEMNIEYFLGGMVEGQKTVSVTKIKVCSFFDEVLLENIDSPYEHGELPFVPILCYHYGAGDLPAGFVRDLKDPQREVNKRRIQLLHILNTTGNGGGFIEDDAMTPKQKEEFKKHGSMPGHFQEVKPMTLAQGKILERAIANPPAGLIQAESQATSDLTAISGINEALMGTDVASTASGRAIELKQKQAITHIAPMFDNLRKAKKQVAFLLWGKRGHKGVIPQYYTEDKVYRIEGPNGIDFMRVNQQIQQGVDRLGNAIYSTMNDLSAGEFDIIVADTTASTTQRQAQLWSLVESVKTLGIPGDLIFDIILDLSDLPNKDDIKQRFQERQQQQAQAAQQQQQAQLELEKLKMQNMNQSIQFRDAPLPVQLAMAAKQGLIDPQIAQYAVDLMVQQMFPALAEQMAVQKQQQEQAMAQQQQQAQLQQLMQAQQGQMPPPQQGNPQQGGGSGLTDAAVKSLMAGNGPAL